MCWLIQLLKTRKTNQFCFLDAKVSLIYTSYHSPHGRLMYDPILGKE